MSLKEFGSMFGGFDEIFKGTYKGFKSTDTMDSVLQKTFANQFRIGSEGVSEFTMQQIQAKAAAMGLTEELTTQAVAMASDADFTAKAKTGKLKWADAVNDSKVNLDELSEALRKTGKVSEKDLNFAKAGKSLDEYRNGLKGIIASNAELADSFIDLGTEAHVASNNLGKGILASLKSFALSPVGIVTIATAIGAAIVAIEDAMHIDQEEAFSALSESLSNYQSSADELNSLNQELETTQSRIQELQALQNAGTISFAEEAELSQLQAQNAELERKISLQEQLNNLDKQQAISDAKTAMDATSLSVAESVRAGDSEGKRTMKGIVGESTSIQAIRDDLKAVEEYKIKIQEMEQTIQDTKDVIAGNAEDDSMSGKLLRNLFGDNTFTDKITEWWNRGDLSAQQKALDDYNKSLSTLQGDLSTQTEYLQTQLDALKLDPEANASAIAEIESALNEVAGIDLSPIEQQYKQIESAFSATSGNDLIRDQLIEAAKSGEDVVDVLHEMGLTLSDLGIKGAGKGDAVRRYFDELAEAATEAQDAINSVDGSVEGVTAAFESANQDADWKTMSDYLSQASELYQQGKVGTDDFQTATQFMTYDTINADADGFKYDADAYVHYWEQAQGKVARYFDENNPIQSVSNALEDLKSAGLATELEGGDNDWTDSFRTSADAAKAWGVSVDAAEAMMHNMESYGAEFDDVFWSGEGLSRYEEALTNLKTIRDEMSSGDGKNRLSGLIEGWDEEYAKYQNDLSGLTEDQVVRIEFEYDLASAQQQIDELDELWEGGDRSAETGAKRIAARSNALSLLEEQTGYSEEQGGGYANLSSAIDTLQDKLSKTDSKKSIANIQEQISAVQDLQQAFQTSMLDGEVANWDEYLNTDGFGEAIQSIMDSTDMSTSDLSELLGIDQNVLDEAVDLKVDADTSEAENKLQGIAANDGKHIVMDVDASTDQIQAQLDKLETGQTITFNAEVDGVDSVINAVKDEEGNITYTATIDGVEQKISPILNKDGTVSYTLGEVPTVLPNADQTVNRNPDNSKVSVNPSSVNQTAVRRPDNSGVMSSPPSVTQTVKRVVSTVVQGGLGVLSGIFNFNGTAHANGTVRIGTALASGDWSVQQNERALVGELGQETVVRDGHFFTVGDNGAEFVNLRRGDVVFNHKQSEELFKNGYVTSGGGRARVVGGSYAFGSAYANGFRFPSGGSAGSSATHTSSSSSSNKGSSSATKAANSAAKAASSASSAANSAAKAADEFKEKFDEVEIWLDRFDRTLNNLTDSIETYSYDLSKQSSVSDQAMNHIRNNLSTLQSAYNRYIQEANSVGLDESWAAKVRNGAINLEDITDEDLKEKIDNFQSYYEKALDVEDTIAELQRELVDLATEKLDNIEQYYENRSDYDDNFGYLTSIEQLATALETYQKELDKQVNDGIIKEFSNEWYEAQSSIAEMQQNLFEAMLKKYQDIIDNLDRISTTLDNSLSLKEARDEPITEEDYQRPLEVANEQIDSLFEKRQKLLEQQAIYDVGSELYDDLADQISDIDDDIFGLLEDIEDLKDKIWEVRWQPFFDGQEALENLRDETEDFRDLLHDDAFVGEFGGLTSEGLTNLALISQSMNASKQSIRNYQEAIKKLTEDYEAGNISTNEYEENLSDFLANIRDGVADVEDFRMEIVDLYTEMLERENEVTQESIKKFSELLDVRKKNDDYAKDIRNQTKDINQLESQIAALQNVNNDSARAELKNLQAQLAEAKDELSQTQKDREYDIRSQGYDYLSEDLDEALESTLNEVTYNAQKQEQVISEMLNNVVNNYQTAYDKINQIIANTGFTPSGDFQQNIDNIGSQPGAQGQVDASNTIAPNYTPDDFVGGINTGQIQTGKDQSKNDAIQEEIEKEPNIDNRPVALIELKPTSLTLQEGQSGSISAHVRPTDAANKTLSWTSSNTSVATVSGGTVKAVKPGSATITCSATDGSGKTATASVTVTKKPDPPKPAPSGGDGVLRVGDRVTFTGQYYYSSWGVKPAGSLYSGVPNGVIVDSYSASKYGGSARFTGGYDVHIRSADGRYGDLGWVSIGQLSGYKDGTLGVTHNQLAKVNEAGKEMIIRAGGSQIAHLQYGDAVLPHNLSENMFTLSSNTHAIMNNLARSSASGNAGDVVINNNYDALLHVEGNVDKDALPGLKNLLEQSYQYTSKKMYQDAGLMGIKKRL